MDSDTEASELDPSDLEERDLWARLPKKFREQVGKSGGQLPRDEILGFLVDSEAEALELMAEFALDDGLAGRSLVELWARVLPRTQRLCQRRGRVDPALQSLVVSSAAAPSIESAEAQQTLSWLKLQSGACRHSAAGRQGSVANPSVCRHSSPGQIWRLPSSSVGVPA
jgi:hypothetical protein